MCLKGVIITFLNKSYCILILSSIFLRVNSHKFRPEEFYAESTHSDGVHELSLYFDGIRVKETVAGPKEGSSSGIVVRQLSNGRQLVNLIYNGVPPYLLPEEGNPEKGDESLLGTDKENLQIRECLVQKDTESVEEFLREFDEKAMLLKDQARIGNDVSSGGNLTYVSLEERVLPDLPNHLQDISSFKELKQKCFSLNREIRKLAKVQRRERRRENHHSRESQLSRRKRGLHELLILPGTKWCGNGRLAESYNDLDGYMVADHCCRDHDLCPSSIPALSRKFGLYNYRLTTISHCSCDKRRSKRGVTNILSIPNTKWCGRGYSARTYDELGGFHGADSCCRQHDLHCPFYIRSFERKYGYFHFGIGTISHCSCDRRFKTCLKQTGTGAADVVGQVFFSIVKSSCFNFKLKKSL